MAARDKITVENMRETEMTLEQALATPISNFNAKAQNYIFELLRTDHAVKKQMIVGYEAKIKDLEKREQNCGDAVCKEKENTYAINTELREKHMQEYKSLTEELYKARAKIAVLENEQNSLQKQADLKVQCAQATSKPDDCS